MPQRPAPSKPSPKRIDSTSARRYNIAAARRRFLALRTDEVSSIRDGLIEIRKLVGAPVSKFRREQEDNESLLPTMHNLTKLICQYQLVKPSCWSQMRFPQRECLARALKYGHHDAQLIEELLSAIFDVLNTECFPGFLSHRWQMKAPSGATFRLPATVVQRIRGDPPECDDN